MKDEDSTLQIILEHIQASKLELKQDIRSLEKRIDTRINTVEKVLTRRLDSVDSRLEFLTDRIYKLECRFEMLELAELPKRVQILEMHTGISSKGR